MKKFPICPIWDSLLGQSWQSVCFHSLLGKQVRLIMIHQHITVYCVVRLKGSSKNSSFHHLLPKSLEQTMYGFHLFPLSWLCFWNAQYKSTQQCKMIYCCVTTTTIISLFLVKVQHTQGGGLLTFEELREWQRFYKREVTRGGVQKALEGKK